MVKDGGVDYASYDSCDHEKLVKMIDNDKDLSERPNTLSITL